MAMLDINLSEAVAYHDGAFPPSTFDHSKVLPALLRATDALARYDQMLKSMSNSDILLAPLRGQEALASSRMEGTFSTLEEVLELQSEGEEEFAEFRSETIETYLYSRALVFAREALQEGRPLSSSLLKEMHQLLLSFGRGADKSPGAFKSEQNYIGDRGSSRVRYVPIAPEKLDSGMEALLKFASDDTWTPLLRVAIAHAEFEALHPFKDGNGRVGRMLITLMLWNLGSISAPHFYISRYFEAHKGAYIDGLRDISTKHTWEEWCNFFLDAVTDQARQNLEVADNTRRLEVAMKDRFRELLHSQWSVKALDFIFANPVFRNSRFTQESGIPAQTAARFSRLLLKEGLLRTVREAAGRKSAVYGFEPLLELVRI